ncbi:stress response protein NST1-like isoform X1 [Bradysia coprophila]|uniref:stress response protein NST1-like isoform X1 n=2 Tax=Bradysia coprophila TaxID=38358 RepID=UPI00187D89CA|nr:stress response protein NST1-like isoform X1 [Bradysia coprophila]
MESSSDDELTARFCSQMGRGSSEETSNSDNTGIRSFYFKDDEDNKTSIDDGSMEFAMFHLDISSSRPSSPDDVGCLTYNINKPDTEFLKRLDQLKKEAFNNWLEGKLNLKKKQRKEALLAEQRLKEEKEKEEQKQQIIREKKLVEWLNRKKVEKEQSSVEHQNPNETAEKTTFFTETKADQTKLNFDAWKTKKLEKKKVIRAKEQKEAREQEQARELQRSMSLEKHKMWLKTAHEKPRPVPLNQGLLSLRGSLYPPINCNPPWISNI